MCVQVILAELAVQLRFPSRSMSHPSLEELRSEKRALAQAAQDVNERLRKARRTAEGAAARKSREWVLQGRLRNTALIIYVWAGFAPEPVVVFLRGAGRQRGWVEKTAAELMDLVESAFDSIDSDELNLFCDEWAPADELAAKRAAACVSQWRTVAWSRSQLAERHVALDTETLAVQFVAIRGAFAENFRPRVWLGAAGARKRGARLRDRWGGRFVAPRPRELLPSAERLGKAGGRKTTRFVHPRCISAALNLGAV